MQDNFLTDEKETLDNRDVALQKDTENIMNGAYEQRAILRKMKITWTHTQNQKERAEASGTHNEER